MHELLRHRPLNNLPEQKRGIGHECKGLLDGFHCRDNWCKYRAIYSAPSHIYVGVVMPTKDNINRYFAEKLGLTCTHETELHDMSDGMLAGQCRYCGWTLNAFSNTGIFTVLRWAEAQPWGNDFFNGHLCRPSDAIAAITSGDITIKLYEWMEERDSESPIPEDD